MSDVTCPNCYGEFTTGCWMCHPEANPVPIEISVPPPIPLPEFDPWEQLRFARDRLRELEAREAQWLSNSHAMAVRLLGQEQYDNSPCQAHPLELVEGRFRELDAAFNLADEKWSAVATKLEAAEAKLQAVRELIPGWKEGDNDFALSNYVLGKKDGRHDCANELKAALRGEE